MQEIECWTTYIHHFGICVPVVLNDDDDHQYTDKAAEIPESQGYPSHQVKVLNPTTEKNYLSKY